MNIWTSISMSIEAVVKAKEISFPAREYMAAEIKRTFICDVKKTMKLHNVSQAELARRMSTSRAMIRRLLDDDDLSVTLATISKTAVALGISVHIELKN
jgi:antitoxin HicB